MGAGLGGVPPSEVAEEKQRGGAGGREVELRRQGRLHVPGVPGGPEGLPREGDGVPADEEGGRRRLPSVPGDSGVSRRRGAGVYSLSDDQDERRFSGEDCREGWEFLIKGGFLVRIVTAFGNCK